MSWRCPLLFLASLLALHAAAAPRAQDKPAGKGEQPKVTFTNDIAPFLAAHCTSCHGGKRPRADFALDKFTNDADALKDTKAWERVWQMVRDGQMPPAERPRPADAEKERLLAWIERDILKIDCTQPRDPGRVTLRRLNKSEYKNTIRDLLGVVYKPADDFPADDVGYGFDNIGDVLTLSPVLLEKYLAAAEQIVSQAFLDPATRKRYGVVEKSGKGGKGGKGKKDQKTTIASPRAAIQDFAGRAFRRPVTAEEVERLMRFLALAEKNGDPPDKGLQLAFQAILVSPHFLFRVEQGQPPRDGEKIVPLTDYELATRLAYFLWSTMPDEELFRLAKEGALRKDGVLDRQVKRMIADPKARALTENFAGQWLQLRMLLNTKESPPDPKRFPAWNDRLRSAMIRETELFFECIVKEDRSILDFLDADFTFVDETLAGHYGLKGVKGEEFRKMSLAGTERRGVLTHASVLTLTSNPTRTAPVKRGKWILENILNAPPPPPPPDVPVLDEGKELMGTLRQRLEQHRSNAVCASCHQRLDPLGFGFENFDAIGAWRTRESDLPVDASGKMPNGQTFNGPVELVQILKGRSAEFRRCLAEKMLTYALGRGLERGDTCTVDDLCAATLRGQDRFSSLVLAVVHSEPFQKIKTR